MRQRLLSLVVLFSLVFSSLAVSGGVKAEESASQETEQAQCTQEYAPVCGVDGVTYSNRCVAEEQNEVEVSYEGECHEIADPSQAKEEYSPVHFAGMLIEIGSTDLPTTIIVRDNATKQDYTINVTEDTVLGQRRDQATKLSDWIPGDQIRVIGKKNKNTEVIDATILVNLSIAIRTNRGVNGWITKIDLDKKEITYQWMNKEHTFRYDDKTHFVAGLKNPATAADLKVGDRIRGRLLLRRGEMPLAKMVVVLRHGKNLYMKIRTFRPNATLVRLDSTIVPTTIQVRIDRTPGLRANDVNNLIGTEGKLVTVNVTADTILTRRFFGRTTLDQFSIGDRLMIVGRVNDDGTVDAKLIKDNSIWRTTTRGIAGEVLAVDTTKNQLIVKWYPVKFLPRKKIKRILERKKQNLMTAQLSQGGINSVQSGSSLKNWVKLRSLKTFVRQRIERLKRLEKKIGRFVRRVKAKKVAINRIKTHNVKIGDLIKRRPARKIRVDVTSQTKIVVGTNTSASLSDIQVGDKVRIRGVMHAKLPIVTAETIVVVSSLPEIEESTETSLDDINEVVTQIVAEPAENNEDLQKGQIVTDVENETEVEVDTEDSGSNTEANQEEESASSQEEQQSQETEGGEQETSSTTTPASE